MLVIKLSAKVLKMFNSNNELNMKCVTNTLW